MIPSVPAGIVLVSMWLTMFPTPIVLSGFLHARTQFSLLKAVPYLDVRRFSSLVLVGMGNPGQDEVSAENFMARYLSGRGWSGGGGV